MRTPHALALFLIACAALVGALLGVSTASAHARHKSSTPAKGEVLATSPTSVTITFTNDIQKIAGTYGIDVLNATGANVTAGPAVLNDDDRSQMSVPLQPSLPPGRYIVEWKNVSDVDGDPFAAAFAFYVATQPTEADLAADRQLAEEEGAGEGTPTAGAASPSPVVGTAVSASPQATSTRAATAGTDDDGGNDSAIWFIIIGGVIAGAAIGFGGYRFFQHNRRG
jgi:methionine-rich copper-binding protein CopC